MGSNLLPQHPLNTDSPGSDSAEASHKGDIIDMEELAKRVPLSERTLRTLIRDRVIPHIRLPGGRRLLFHWNGVEAALLRFEKGGIR